jgi:hypothetical protein
MYGGLEQIYLEAWRTGATLLQTTQAPREVRVDPGGRSSFRSAQGLPVQATILTDPRKKEQLLIYLAVTTHVVSTSIIDERQEDGHAYPVQRPVYFVSEVITSWKLRHYIQEYSITVVTNYPLGDILRNQDAIGRISKWAVELSALNINFKPRTTIKSQALVEFMVEWRENQLPTPTERPEH